MFRRSREVLKTQMTKRQRVLNTCVHRRRRSRLFEMWPECKRYERYPETHTSIAIYKTKERRKYS